MSLVKFGPRPWGNLITSDFFDNDDFFNRRSLLRRNLDEPALNIKETEKAFEIELAAPGFSKKDFKVDIDQGCLNITAEHSSSKNEEEDNFTRKEFSYNSFQKSLRLPEDVKHEDVHAKYRDGVLRLELHKIKSKAPQKKAIAID